MRFFQSHVPLASQVVALSSCSQRASRSPRLFTRPGALQISRPGERHPSPWRTQTWRQSSCLCPPSRRCGGPSQSPSFSHLLGRHLEIVLKRTTKRLLGHLPRLITSLLHTIDPKIVSPALVFMIVGRVVHLLDIGAHLLERSPRAWRCQVWHSLSDSAARSVKTARSSSALLAHAHFPSGHYPFSCWRNRQMLANTLEMLSSECPATAWTPVPVWPGQPRQLLPLGRWIRSGQGCPCPLLDVIDVLHPGRPLLLLPGIIPIMHVFTRLYIWVYIILLRCKHFIVQLNCRRLCLCIWLQSIRRFLNLLILIDLTTLNKLTHIFKWNNGWLSIYNVTSRITQLLSGSLQPNYIY